MKNKFRSNLSIAKNLGSSHSGSHHWWHQRFTAIMLALSILWLFNFVWSLSESDVANAIEIVQRPYNIIMLSIFTLTGFYHSVLGIQVIIEDYITCRTIKIVMLLFVQIFSIVTSAAFFISTIYVMIL